MAECLYSPNSYVEALTPNGMVLGSGASGRSMVTRVQPS